MQRYKEFKPEIVQNHETDWLWINNFIKSILQFEQTVCLSQYGIFDNYVSRNKERNNIFAPIYSFHFNMSKQKVRSVATFYVSAGDSRCRQL